MREYTPENITSRRDLPSNARLFVGTNTEGRHGKGGALIGHKHFGMKYGIAKGPTGEGYGIITKDLRLGMRSISLDIIYDQLIDALIYAENNPQEKCYFLKLGSSLAGYSVAEIKKLFFKIYTAAYIPENVILPKDYEVRN